jgi:outer membrane receptor protein involved in Fe transport
MVTNVGDAEIDGMSLEFSAFLWDSLDFGLNVQVLDPRTTSANALVGTRDGDRLPFSPEEKGAAWLEYTFPQEMLGGHLYSRYQFTYQGNSLNGITRPRQLQPAYQISDFKVGLESDTWEVYAYVDNMFDERAVLYDQQSAPLGMFTINFPRTWGLGFSKSWGSN